MPLPKTQNVGKVMHFLKKEKSGMPQKQKVAISLNQSRKHGADIPEAEDAVKKATS
jgi:hypothetical protein